MRDRWVTGSATDLEDNYIGRYITPWREDDEPILDPLRFPLEPLTTRQFAVSVWRVYSWIVSWTASFRGPNFSLTTGSTFFLLPIPTNPPPGQTDALLPNEEHRLGAGFQHIGTESIPVAHPGGISSVSCTLGGTHRYNPPTVNTQQRFNMFLRFVYSLDLAPDAPAGARETGTWGILSPLSSGDSIGVSTLSIPSYDESAFPTYTGIGGMSFIGGGPFLLAGPATVTASLSIQPFRWWERRNGAGLDPIFDGDNGVPLRSTRAAPSTEPVGDVIATLPGTRFIA